LAVDIARITAKAVKVSGASGASTPPARTTRATPSRMRRSPSPIAMAPEAQELEFPIAGPRDPSSIATWQAPAPANTRRARLGGTERGPSARNSA